MGLCYPILAYMFHPTEEFLCCLTVECVTLYIELYVDMFCNFSFWTSDIVCVCVVFPFYVERKSSCFAIKCHNAKLAKCLAANLAQNTGRYSVLLNKLMI